MYIGNCPGVPAGYQASFSSAETHITEADAPQIFTALGGPSPWQAYLRANLQAKMPTLPARQPIRIVTREALGRLYRNAFGGSTIPADAQGFVDRRQATIYLGEFPAGNVGKSMLGPALHEAVHLFSHPPGRSSQLRATAYPILGPALLEGLTQAVTEDIQTTQCIRPLRERWRPYQTYLPVVRRFLGVFGAKLVGDAFFQGQVAPLVSAAYRRWTQPAFHAVRDLLLKGETSRALQRIEDLEKAYAASRPKMQKLHWSFR